MAKVAIQPRVLKGFRDYLPQSTIPRNELIDTVRAVFGSYGFVPIDTPALEYADILLGKGSDETDKQLYRFQDNGKRDVALRFDLTVPLARFAAMHINELGTPFRRYHIAPVWRAEKPQRGRYREFIQCDFDIIGVDSVLADAEIISVIHHCFAAAEINHCIRINNRKILNGFLESMGAEETSTAVLRAIDKLDKIGAEGVSKELAEEAKLDSSQIDKVLAFTSLAEGTNGNAEILEKLENFFAGNETASLGVSQLKSVVDAVTTSGIGDTHCRIDLAIARGLDYYTGTVFETTFSDLPEIGSVCSGGRYDDLAGLYTKQHLPGVGASIGLDRVLAGLEELNRTSERKTTANALVSVLDQRFAAKSMALATSLRAAGIAVEMYPQVAKLGAQLKYANRKNIRYVVLAGSQEFESNTFSVKDLQEGSQEDGIAEEKLASYLLSKIVG